MTAVAGNSSTNVTTAAAWQSSNPSVMTVSGAGLAVALADGSVTISATYQGATGSRALTIFPTEVCLPYNTANLSVVQAGDSWLLSDGVQSMLSLDTFTDALNALALARRYSSLCYIGRNNVRSNRLAYIVNFWHGDTGVATSISPEDCTPYSPAALQITSLGTNGWAVTDGAQQLLLLETQADATVATTEAKKYSAQCFIGRQNTRPNPLSFIQQDLEVTRAVPSAPDRIDSRRPEHIPGTPARTRRNSAASRRVIQTCGLTRDIARPLSPRAAGRGMRWCDS